jgi:hypothetical protein
MGQAAAVAAPRRDNFLDIDRLAGLAADQYADDLLILQQRLTEAYIADTNEISVFADYEYEIGEAVRRAMKETADESLSVRRSCIGAAAMEAVKARAQVMAAQYIADNQPSAIDLLSLLEDDRAFRRWAVL